MRKPLWPRPRTGDRVRLKNGKTGEVIALTKANDVLRGKTEMEALLMGPRLQALYGSKWQDIYFEAQVMLDEDMAVLKIATPNDIAEVL